MPTGFGISEDEGTAAPERVFSSGKDYHMLAGICRANLLQINDFLACRFFECLCCPIYKVDLLRSVQLPKMKVLDKS